jgi:hypothetical protein
MLGAGSDARCRGRNVVLGASVRPGCTKRQVKEEAESFAKDSHMLAFFRNASSLGWDRPNGACHLPGSLIAAADDQQQLAYLP